MDVNVSGRDKQIRIWVGVLLLVLAIYAFKGSLLLIFFGYISLATGLLGFCPVYKYLGKNTAKDDVKRE